MSKSEAKMNRELLMLERENAPRIGESLNGSQSRRVLIIGTTSNIPDLNADPLSESEGEENVEPEANAQAMIGAHAQSRRALIVGTTSNIPDLNEEPCAESDGEANVEPEANAQAMIGLAPQEANAQAMIGLAPQAANDVSDLDAAIFARVSCLEYWKLLVLNRQFSRFLKSREIFRVRQNNGLVQPYMFLLPGSDTRWTMFDKSFQNFKKLPQIPSDFCFLQSDKETITAGTHLIVIGREVKSMVVWRFELEHHKWIKDPSMITPRAMYASATCGQYAYFAGGIQVHDNGVTEVLSMVVRYSAETKTWTTIREMHKRRKFCSGCFLRGKFYVIGGKNEKEENLTCGESYDEVTDSWTLIPDMLKDVTSQTLTFLKSPPLVAVVNDNLYLVNTYENELCVYDINANAWKKLGTVPVRADSVGGWGVAFKSLGDRLLLIGSLVFQSMNEPMSVYTSRPSPNAEEIIWERINIPNRGVEFNHFIKNCCVMFA